MIFILGIHNGGCNPGFRSCLFPCCGLQQGILSYTFQQATVFFMPAFRFSRRYFLRCPHCGRIYEITPSAGRRLEQDERARADLRSVPPITPPCRRCSKCGGIVSETANYCPACGAKL